MIPPPVLEQIRAANDIVDVIGACLPLKRAGANFTALCPFHREKTPSFNVNPQRQIFHCFGCHKGGDVFAFVKEYENITFIEAVRRLAERARIPLEFEQGPGERKARFLKETLLQMHEQICQRWQSALANEAQGQIARDYLAHRGVAPEAVKLFRLGYAPDAWDDTVNWAKSKGYELPMAEQAGLIIRKEAEGRGEAHYYDRFRGRLMFPICDEQSRVIAFSGRVLSGDEKTAKYVNSPETPIFSKGRVMFGLDKAKRAIAESDEVIICEGQLDVIACHSTGIKNVVAPQGTALTADHARILRRYVDLATVCFDADRAGWSAAIRSLDPLLGAGLAVLVAVVPAPHDPDSLVRALGPDAFRQVIKEAEGFFDFYLNYLCSVHDPGSDRGRLAITAAMAEAVNKTNSPVQIDKYCQKTAQRLGVSVDAMREEVQKAAQAPRGSRLREDAPAQAPESVAAATAPPSPSEAWLLKLLLLDEELVPWAMDYVDLNWLQHAGVRKVVERRFADQREGAWKGVASLLGELGEDAELQRLVSAAVAEKNELKNRQQNLAQIVQRLRDQAIDRQLTEISRRLADPKVGKDDAIQLQTRDFQLRLAKREPLRPLIE